MPIMQKKLIPNVKFRCRLGDHEIEGYVVNPGGWWPEERGTELEGKTVHLYLIQIAIANALNPFVAVEAGSEQDAIDTLADSEQFGHLINVPDEDVEEWEKDHGEDTCRAGNDGHPIDLDNVHLQEAPRGVKYFLEWTPTDDELSAAVESGIEELREERLEEQREEEEG